MVAKLWGVSCDQDEHLCYLVICNEHERKIFLSCMCAGERVL